MVKSSHARRAVVAATTAVTLVSGAAMSVHASEIQRAYAEHTAACLSLFFSDREAHAAQCLPNNSPNVWVEGTSGSPVPVPVVPPVVVAPPPPPPVVTPPGPSYPPVASGFA